jgi:hypothetical protein
MPGPQIRIPDEVRPGFIGLRDLDESGFHELFIALENAPFIYNPNTLQKELLTQLRSIPEVNARGILLSVLPLYELMFQMGLSVDEFAQELQDAALEAEILFPESDQGLFRKL